MSNNNRSNTNLFALVDDESMPVRRIDLAPELRKELGIIFSEQQRVFCAGRCSIEFIGGYNIEDDEIFEINPYSLPPAILSALNESSTILQLDLKTEIHRIIAIFMGKLTEQGTIVNFQIFDKSKLLSNRSWTLILLNNNIYKRLEDPGLVLQNKLTAHYTNGKLLFTSYHNANRFLDLGDYYEAATDNDLKNFIRHQLFKLENENEDDFINNADFMIRKKIAWLLRNKMLDKLSVKIIKAAEEELNQGSLEEYKIHIEISNNKVFIPKNIKKLKELIRFLCEDYFKTILTKSECVTTSKKYRTKKMV